MTAGDYIRNILLLGIFGIALSSCTGRKSSFPVIYQGPLREVDSMETTYLEEGVLKLKIRAGKIFEFPNGDQEFPNGIRMEFYDGEQLLSTMQANKAYYFKAEKKWRGQGKVKVDNIKNRQKLNTEELFWMSSTERIFTSKFISIRMGDELIYGTGLDAAQDLSDYIIKDPGGEFEIDE